MDHTPGGIAVSLNHLAYTNGFIPPKLSCYGEGWGNSLCGQELCVRGRIWCDEVSWNVTTSIKLLMNIFKSVCSCMVWTKVMWKNLKWGSELECDSKVSSCPWISLSICSWCCAWKNRMWGSELECDSKYIIKLDEYHEYLQHWVVTGSWVVML